RSVRLIGLPICISPGLSGHPAPAGGGIPIVRIPGIFVGSQPESSSQDLSEVPDDEFVLRIGGDGDQMTTPPEIAERLCGGSGLGPTGRGIQRNYGVPVPVPRILDDRAFVLHRQEGVGCAMGGGAVSDGDFLVLEVDFALQVSESLAAL